MLPNVPYRIALLAAFCIPTESHMQMLFPPPRGDPSGRASGPPDYDIKSPMPSAAMCKGRPPGSPAVTYNAGDVIPVKFKGSARHGGGYCQFALSYDDDQTFVVIEGIDGACPDENTTWPVQLPPNLPSCNRCTFAWTWINAIGNREFYMNCADIRIMGGNRGRGIVGKKLIVANLPGYPVIQPKARDGGLAASNVKHYPVQVV